ncbi:MAG: bifunctional adenosylcobinamide kinase/adenosylcobinamide-phosphate guanylyltransferase [Spirochaetes bacterium]|nr:bifunctional adenosylcobinamide kinase/adenosylcobinamide-phosphate guanylyltransferase [Spirochaetota bacterium]
MKIMITGGVKSGKSSFALKKADTFPGKKLFIATATAFDDEMRKRIARHRQERSSEYITVEEPLYLRNIRGDNIVLDCLTMWMNNLFFKEKEEEWQEILMPFLDNLPENAVIVTNEVGLGNIPPDTVSRKYNEYLAAANKLTAEKADRVVMMVAGLPLYLK